jgi:hypothetical protein
VNTAGMIEALIPLCGGIYATLLGFGVIRLRKANPGVAALALVPRPRWLGPVVTVFGLWTLWQGYRTEGPPRSRLCAGCGRKVTLPVAVYEVTRLDAFDGEGQRIIYRMTITNPLQNEAETDALLAALRERLRSQRCTNENYQRLFGENIALEFVYTIGGKPYPAILVTPADCGHS